MVKIRGTSRKKTWIACSSVRFPFPSGSSMHLNQPVTAPPQRTHEGAPAPRLTPLQELRRSVLTCLLWEDPFYESGVGTASRIQALVAQCDPKAVAALAVEARTTMKLRHVPLLLARELARLAYPRTDDVLAMIIQRPDELTEFLAIYWKDGRVPLAASVKRGLARAFPQFSAYDLAKYNRKTAVKLRDVLFLCHPTPKYQGQEAVWKQLVEGTLPTPDTWEVALSATTDKRGTWERLLREHKLGALALLRNLRNMDEAGVPHTRITTALDALSMERVLPFRFLAAAREVRALESVLERAMFRMLARHSTLPGTTILLVDISASMSDPVSAHSALTRSDAGAALAILLRELCATVRIFAFSHNIAEVPGRRGMALRDAINRAMSHEGTLLGRAVTVCQAIPHDRLIVLTDEQSQDPVPGAVKGVPSYMINLAGYQHGVGYHQGWTNITGFSEGVIDYIQASESESGSPPPPADQ